MYFSFAALLKEFPRDDICPQILSRNNIFANSTSGHTIIFGAAHSRTHEAVSDALRGGHNVLFLSTTQMNQHQGTNHAYIATTKLRAQDTTHSCSSKTFKYVFQTYDVKIIHLLFSEHDFHKHTSSKDLGNLLECYIKFLNALSKHSKSKAVLYLHLPVSTQFPHEYEADLGESPSTERLHQLMDDLRCKMKFNYKENIDVFLKTVQIYVLTFKRLYHLPLNLILS